MAKLTNVRERIHQPYRDTLLRTAGLTAGQVQDNSELFTVAGKNDGETNFRTGSVFPSDQSMVVLALRVYLSFRNPIQRGPVVTVDGGTDYPQENGDFQYNGAGSTYDVAQSNIADGQAPATIQDIHRLYVQSEEQLLWNFGAGQKLSMISMPSWYFPAGGGLHGDLGGSTDLLWWNNGMPGQESILKLARAILIPPRQNIICKAQIVGYNTTNTQVFNTTQGARQMLSLRDNLNAVDLAQKVIAFVFDGLFSRDVQ